MVWEANGFDWLDLVGGPLDDPASLDALEQRFWLDLWHAPDLDAAEEMRIESRWYGPLQAMAVSGLAEEPLLNLILGAAAPGAAEEGHLDEALDWVESLGLDCSIPITGTRAGAAAAEDLLNQRGYRHSEYLARFLRVAEPPDFPEPSGIEVDEIEEFAEGFSELITGGLGLPLVAGSLFDCLPGRTYWRSYFAVDENEHCVAAATMMRHFDIAQLGFAATAKASRRKGCHLALVRRRILDAAEAGCRLLFAETREPLDDGKALSPGAQSLLRAGFEQVALRPVWRAEEE
jgi:hypothetical protein